MGNMGRRLISGEPLLILPMIYQWSELCRSMLRGRVWRDVLSFWDGNLGKLDLSRSVGVLWKCGLFRRGCPSFQAPALPAWLMLLADEVPTATALRGALFQHGSQGKMFYPNLPQSQGSSSWEGCRVLPPAPRFTGLHCFAPEGRTRTHLFTCFLAHRRDTGL